MKRTLAIRECPKCRQTIRVIEYEGVEVALDLESGEEHDCWHVDADILVMEDFE